MQRIFDPTAQALLPGVPALTGTVGFFAGAVPGVSAATRVRAWWLNMLQEEFISVLAAAGITPDTTGTNFTQILAAIKVLAAEAVAGGAVPLTAALIEAALTYVPVTPTALAAEATTRSTVDTDLNNGLTAETAARVAGDAAVEAWVSALNKPTAAATSAAGVAYTTITASVSFTAPGPGWLLLTTSRQYSYEPPVSGDATSYINGAVVCHDNTRGPVSHSCVQYTGGGAVSAQVSSSCDNCSQTAYVSLLYVPYI